MECNQVVVMAGSNIDPEDNFQQAQINLRAIATLIKQSQIYRTTPREFSDQADFLNGAFLLETTDSPTVFKEKLKAIERQQGRVKTSNKAGPRTIDLDITVWNGAILDEHFWDWDFVRNCVLEVLPDLVFMD